MIEKFEEKESTLVVEFLPLKILILVFMNLIFFKKNSTVMIFYL
jgi:hypothetical protein